jgi:ketosteroid isomerase-like protein
VRVPWKLIGVAGLAGVAASGVVVARRRRAHSELDPEEVRDRLHRRLAEARGASSTNLDFVRSIRAAWERGDYSSAEWAHPDVELVIADGPTPGRWTGPDGMAEGFRTIAATWDEFRDVADEYRELDDERVLALVHFSGRGKTSGLDLAQVGAKGASLFHVHGGKVTRLVLYFDREHALAELGLR